METRTKTHVSWAIERQTCKEKQETRGWGSPIRQKDLARSINKDAAPETGVGELEGHSAHVSNIGQSSTSHPCS
jgi:hypothetical protein